MECCDICGDIGVAEAILTCSLCKRNSEHMYCMKIPLEEHVNDWHCEECSMSTSPSSCYLKELSEMSRIKSLELCKGGEMPPESGKLPNESRVGTGDWEKRVATGKTKYISVKEAIKLSSGEKLPYMSSSKTSPSKTPPKHRRNGMCKFGSGPFRPPNPRRPAIMEIHKTQLQQSRVTGFTSQSRLRPSEALKDKHLAKEQPSKVQFPVTTRAMKQSSLPSANTSPVAISGGDGHDNAIVKTTSGAEPENTSEIRLLDSEKYLLVPALDTLWKGSFRILGDHSQEDMYHLVQAHPPSRVRKKIYEFSKEMPEELQFKLVPSKPLWNNLFNEYTPDRSDIGLYFFPGDGERSEEDYILLVNQIISTNYALRYQIADFELLVFSSKLLHANCQCWNGKYYLWGVFHRLKRNATVLSDDTPLQSTVQPSDGMIVNHDQSQVHNDGEVDMDIDMIGGVNVGRIDIPVTKEPKAAVAVPESALQVSTGLRIAPVNREPKTVVSLPESALQAATGLRISPVATIPAPNVKIESHDLIPPGFEEVYKLRIQSSFPVVNIGNQDVNKWHHRL